METFRRSKRLAAVNAKRKISAYYANEKRLFPFPSLPLSPVPSPSKKRKRTEPEEEEILKEPEVLVEDEESDLEEIIEEEVEGEEMDEVTEGDIFHPLFKTFESGKFSGDLLNERWKKFSKTRARPNKKRRLEDSAKDIWVSATKVKNYIQKDPILDWLNLYYRKVRWGETTPAAKARKEPNFSRSEPGLQILFDRGNEFEEKVIDKLEAKFPGLVFKIASGPSDLWDAKKIRETYDCVNRGCPFIAQAVLHNPFNRTCGIADLLVRSDYLNKLMESEPLEDHELHYKAPAWIAHQ